MSPSTKQPAYMLGNSSQAEYRLQLLNEITGKHFVEALGNLPNHRVRILNIGCGSGHLEQMISPLFVDSEFIGIDISAQRIQEAKQRNKSGENGNTFSFLQKDVTKLTFDDLGQFDILISRFVLSHLPKPIEVFNHLSSAVRPGGYICFQETASVGKEYKSVPPSKGYQLFVNLVDTQTKEQNCRFDSGYDLFARCREANWTIHTEYVEVPRLDTSRTKSILRLGVEDARALLIEKIGRERVDEVIRCLAEFERDPNAVGFYTQSIVVVAQK